jgi:hypothetical protein
MMTPFARASSRLDRCSTRGTQICVGGRARRLWRERGPPKQPLREEGSGGNLGRTSNPRATGRRRAGRADRMHGPGGRRRPGGVLRRDQRHGSWARPPDRTGPWGRGGGRDRRLRSRSVGDGRVAPVRGAPRRGMRHLRGRVAGIRPGRRRPRPRRRPRHAEARCTGAPPGPGARARRCPAPSLSERATRAGRPARFRA